VCTLPALCSQTEFACKGVQFGPLVWRELQVGERRIKDCGNARVVSTWSAGTWTGPWRGQWRRGGGVDWADSRRAPASAAPIRLYQLVMYPATVMCPRLLGATQRRPYLEPEPFKLIADYRVLVATWRELKTVCRKPRTRQEWTYERFAFRGDRWGQDMRRLASVYCGNVEPVRDRPASRRSLSKSNLRGAA
jgi:hypothetical protein